MLLAAPGTAADRYAAIGAASRGFVYCVATYGVTGARAELAENGPRRRRRDAAALHDLPLLVGVGIASPEQAADAACGFADGVIVGSALMTRLLDGDRDGRWRSRGRSGPRCNRSEAAPGAIPGRPDATYQNPKGKLHRPAIRIRAAHAVRTPRSARREPRES